jgi:DNA-binding GntR family transcriptional regulator
MSHVEAGHQGWMPIQTPPKAAPIARHTLTDELAERLREMIVKGELRPDGRIMIQRLCRRFGVSRTPLREALKMLAGEGLVLLLPNKSAVVERTTRETIDELLPILGALEVLAGQLACERMDEADLARIHAQHQKMLCCFQAGDEKSFVEAEDTVRCMVFAAAGSTTLNRIHTMLMTKLRWPLIATKAPPEWALAMEEQRRMLQALQVRDGEMWALAARRHLRHRVAVLRDGFERLSHAMAPSRRKAARAGVGAKARQPGPKHAATPA